MLLLAEVDCRIFRENGNFQVANFHQKVTRSFFLKNQTGKKKLVKYEEKKFFLWNRIACGLRFKNGSSQIPSLILKVRVARDNSTFPNSLDFSSFWQWRNGNPDSLTWQKFVIISAKSPSIAHSKNLVIEHDFATKKRPRCTDLIFQKCLSSSEKVKELFGAQKLPKLSKLLRDFGLKLKRCFEGSHQDKSWRWKMKFGSCLEVVWKLLMMKTSSVIEEESRKSGRIFHH